MAHGKVIVALHQSKWPCIKDKDQLLLGDILVNLLEDQGYKRCHKKKRKLKTELKEVVFGFNEVTKFLEKDALDLVLVCNPSTNSSFILSHIANMCTRNKIMAGNVPTIKNLIENGLNLSSCLALGIKKSLNPAFKEAVAKIKALLPPLHSGLPHISSSDKVPHSTPITSKTLDDTTPIGFETASNGKLDSFGENKTKIRDISTLKTDSADIQGCKIILGLQPPTNISKDLGTKSIASCRKRIASQSLKPTTSTNYLPPKTVIIKPNPMKIEKKAKRKINRELFKS